MLGMDIPGIVEVASIMGKHESIKKYSGYE